jgi:hypothetical protein
MAGTICTTTKRKKLLLWATPNGGIAEVLDTPLESFLVRQIFQPA